MALSKIKSSSIADTAIHGRRNLIINGAMQVAQRGTSQTGITTSGYHTVDRVRLLAGSAGTYTTSQVADSPSGQGFYFSYKLDCTTSDTYSGSGDELLIRMGSLEQQDCLKFNYGGSSAEKLTLSFWAKFSYADTFNVALVNHVAQRSNFKPFTISSADTWQKITITYDGDTNSGDGFANSTALGLSIDLWLGGGSNFSGGSATSGVWDERSNNNTSLVAASTKFGTSTDHELFITGVQLEIGEQATPFEHRSFGEELALCQRYYHRISRGSGASSPVSVGFHTGTQHRGLVHFTTAMRSSPTVDKSSLSDINVYHGGGIVNPTAISNEGVSDASITAVRFAANSTGASNGDASIIQLDADSFIDFDSEL